MRKEIKKVSALLGGATRPTVALYESAMKTLPNKEAEQLNKALFRLSFCDWEELPNYYRKFLLRLYVHDRELLLHYLLEKTPLGAMRYKVYKPELFIKLLHIMESSRKDKASLLHLAICLKLVFDIPYKVSTLTTYLKRPLKKTQPKDYLKMMGIVKIEDDWE